jgi:hypothetical protein
MADTQVHVFSWKVTVSEVRVTNMQSVDHRFISTCRFLMSVITDLLVEDGVFCCWFLHPNTFAKSSLRMHTPKA